MDSNGLRNLRVLFVSYRDPHHPDAGGAAMYTQEIASRLSRRGHQVSRVCMSFRESKPLEFVDGVLTYRVGNPLTYYLLSALKLFQLRGEFDLVVEEVGSGGLPTFATFLTRVPSLILVIQIQKEVFREELPFPLGVVSGGLEDFFYSLCRFRSRRFVTISESVKQELVSLGMSEDKVRVCTPSLGLTPKHDGDGEPSYPTRHLLLVLSRMRRYKCIDQAVKAFNQARRMIDDYSLLIIAKPADLRYTASVKKLITRLGLEEYVSIKENASKEEKIAALRSAKLLLYPSRAEGFGMVAIEAASIGKPVIAYDVPGLRDAVSNGETGILVPYGDITAFARAIVRLVQDEDLYSSLSRRGPEWSKSHSWETSVDLFETEIRKECNVHTRKPNQ